jgi:fluoride ion exporter CrcB/FEX
MKDVTLEIIVVNANLHAAPIVMLCIDMVYNTFRFPKRHFHIVLAFGVLYAIINLSYSLSAHIIYKPIDWVSILSYILMGSSVVMAFIMHWLGRYIFRKCKKHKVETQMMEGLIHSNNRSQNEEILNDNKGIKRHDSNEQTTDPHNIYN